MFSPFREPLRQSCSQSPASSERSPRWRSIEQKQRVSTASRAVRALWFTTRRSLSQQWKMWSTSSMPHSYSQPALTPQRVPRLPALGKMEPGKWYFLPSGVIDPHQQHDFATPTIALAVNVKYHASEGRRSEGRGQNPEISRFATTGYGRALIINSAPVVDSL